MGDQIKILKLTNGNELDLQSQSAVSVQSRPGSGHAIIRIMGKSDSFASHQHPDLKFYLLLPKRVDIGCHND
jgi:hypothetical protein